MPEWVSFVENTDTCEWNFTAGGSSEPCHMWTDTSFEANKVTIQLWNTNHNLTMFRFPDIVSFNFTLSIDPGDIIPRGKGDVHSMVVAYASCTYFGMTTEELCGPYRGNMSTYIHEISLKCIPGTKLTVSSPECLDPHVISDPCGLSASSALDESTLPENVLNNDDSYWAPAIR